MSFMDRIDKIKLAIKKGITCNPETGKVYGVRGKEITYTDKDGYIIIRIMYKQKQFSIKSHQFVWYYVNKTIVNEIDHINRLRDDNRIINLRGSNRFNNMQNTNAKGYYFCNRQKKYVAKITKNRKNTYLGSYLTEEEARQAYIKAKKHHFPTTH